VDLFKFLNKKVELISTENQRYTGIVTHHTIAGDNDPEEESISFIPDNGIMKGRTAEVGEHEIKSIRILDD
jgi:hypothetical protein